MANANYPVVKGMLAKEGLLRCICCYCGEPHFHPGIGLHRSACKNHRLRSVYYVVLHEADMEAIKRQIQNENALLSEHYNAFLGHLYCCSTSEELLCSKIWRIPKTLARAAI